MEDKVNYYDMEIREVIYSLAKGKEFIGYGILPNSLDDKNFISLIEWWNNFGVTKYNDTHRIEKIFRLVMRMKQQKIIIFNNLGDLIDIIDEIYKMDII
jgi:hypothetical protein